MAKKFNLKINGSKYLVEGEEEMPILWVLRDLLNLKGTKFGCGKGLCGACTIHVNGVATKSCQLTLADVAGGEEEITTIEGSTKEIEVLRSAWDKYNVPQCGYCQPGQIMCAASLLKSTPHPQVEQIEAEMEGNICRCGTYLRLKKAIYFAAHNKEI